MIKFKIKKKSRVDEGEELDVELSDLYNENEELNNELPDSEIDSEEPDDEWSESEIENEEPTAQTVSDDVLISCDGLVKIYKTKDVEVLALQGLDIDIKKGELMAIIGKSGSGKSTLMNIIGGLEKPTAGKIIVGGKLLTEMTEKEMVKYRKTSIGFVWQKSGRNLFPYLTSLENIEAPMNFTGMSSKAKRERALELIEMVGIAHKADSYPSQMSGGEQQRVAIAVALANLPEILLADEPTGAVDSKTSNKIQDLFRELTEKMGITVIIVTHDINLSKKVDRVVMISDGKISTEKVLKTRYKEQIADMLEFDEIEDTHDEYSVMDKAHRVQLSEDILSAAGIDSNKVKISLENGKVVITGE